MIIHAAERDAGSQNSHFLFFTSLCFALFRHFWWLDWLLPALNPTAWRTFTRQPTMISKEGPLWRSRHFLSHLRANRKTCIQRYLCLSGSTPRHLWLWFILVAGTCWIKVNGSGSKNPDAKYIKKKKCNIIYLTSLGSYQVANTWRAVAIPKTIGPQTPCSFKSLGWTYIFKLQLFI